MNYGQRFVTLHRKQGTRPSPRKRNAKAAWLSEEALQIAVKRREAKSMTLCHPVDCSLPGLSVHKILQASILEWIAISFSRGRLDQGIETMSPTFQADSLLFEPPGKPVIEGMWAFLQIKGSF